jgi:hypothetical protein
MTILSITTPGSTIQIFNVCLPAVAIECVVISIDALRIQRRFQETDLGGHVRVRGEHRRIVHASHTDRPDGFIRTAFLGPFLPESDHVGAVGVKPPFAFFQLRPIDVVPVHPLGMRCAGNDSQFVSHPDVVVHLAKLDRAVVHRRPDIVQLQPQHQLEDLGVGFRSNVLEVRLECLGRPWLKTPVLVIDEDPSVLHRWRSILQLHGLDHQRILMQRRDIRPPIPWRDPDRLLIPNQITGIRIASCTNISDTLYLSAEYLTKQAPNYRRAVILISDNEGTDRSTSAGQLLGCSGSYDMAQARNELLEDNATLFNIRATIDDPSIQQNQARLAPWIVYDQEILLSVGATGGEQFRVNSAFLLSQALGDSITKLRKQITLGFYPASANKPGVFHKLTVNFANANRCPGCQIHSRSGYYSGVPTSSPPPLTANKTSSSYNEQVDEVMIKIMMEDILSENVDSNDIPFNVDTTPQTDAKGKPELKLNLKIQFDQIDSPIKNNKHQCKVRVLIFYGRDAAGFNGSREAKISGGLNDDQYNKFLKEGIPLSINVPLVDKKQKMKVIVYDETSDRVGCQTIHYAAPK